MQRQREARATENSNVPSFFKKACNTLFPTNRDNLKQVAIKLLFLISIAAFVFIAVDTSVIFYKTARQEKIETNVREIWHNSEYTVSERFAVLKEINADVKAWINIDGTEIDYPVYKTDNNEFYVNHNMKQQRDYHGALFLGSKDVIDYVGSDKKIAIYGNDVADGSMFGTLGNYRSYDFYKEHSCFTITSRFGVKNYKVFSVMLLDSADNENFNVLQEKFTDNDEFFDWYCETYNRSIITVELDVDRNDEIVVLMTDASDFKGAKLAVLARKQRVNESYSQMPLSFVNPAPKYPRKWYKTKGIDYPH